MLRPFVVIFVFISVAMVFAKSQNYFDQVPSSGSGFRLSKPLIGDGERIYACAERNLFAFESNGSVAWTLHLGYRCNLGMAPVHGGRRNIYLVAEDRVLKVNFSEVGSPTPASEVFFGPEKGQNGSGEIIGLAVSTPNSCVYINIKNRGLFAYTIRGQLLWSIGPVLSQMGYLLGCRKGIEDCYFDSIPVIDQCEASLYISNTAGELYSVSLRSRHFNWVLDLSSFDKSFTITPGNNGRLYVLVAVRSLVLALDVSTGSVLWQTSIGPLSSAEYAPVVDSNGWLSVGSLDGFLYTISPTGVVKKFTKASELDYVVQVRPYLDCSGYAVYVSQTEMEGKISSIIGEYTYVSAMRPKGAIFTLLVPATETIYWSERYPGQFSTLLSQSDLQHFVLDEGILLAFIAASGSGNPLPCRSKHQKLLSSCSQAKPPKKISIYTGNEKIILLFLLLESILMLVLAGLVRFCCIFWAKRKLQDQGLGNFLEKRRSLQLKKKAYSRTITELEKKAAEEAVGSAVIEELGDLVIEREHIERKLSTTYSLGRDVTSTGSQHSKSLLPVHDGITRSYSFQSAKKESVTIFHTLGDTSSAESSSTETEREPSRTFQEQAAMEKANPNTPVKTQSSSDDDGDGTFVKEYQRSASEPASSSKGCLNPLFVEQVQGQEEMCDKGEVVESLTRRRGGSKWLKRRRDLSSTKSISL